MDTAGIRFFTHGEHVVTLDGGRAGVVKDICGLEVNVIWDDDASRTWVPVTALAARG